ncbi:MAG TPA: hypothetical protein VFX16_26845 [Pseudonocardiaceae bacterium]|nr:hypothetical protein [Pseudonocardiaceae bacterium]
MAQRHAAGVARELRAEIGELRAELHASVAELCGAVDRLGGLVGRIDWTEGEVRRIGPHVAAVDQRVAGLERQPVGPATGEEQVAARSLVTEIQTEHARIRTRLSAVAAYEHRIAAMEEAVTILAAEH